MNEELDNKLVKAFPLLYGDRNAPMQSTAMCWGFSCSASLRLERLPIVQEFLNLELPEEPLGVRVERPFFHSSHLGSRAKAGTPTVP